MRILVLLLVCMSLACSLSAESLREGMNRDEVESLLGRPSSVIRRGEREIWYYSGNRKIVLEKNLVIEFAGAFPERTDPSPLPSPEPEPADPVTAPISQPAPALGKEPSPSIPQPPAAQKAALDAYLENPSPGFEAQPKRPGYAFWVMLGIASLFKVLITAVVLKLAFKWAEVDADWHQMWLPAIADTLTRGTIVALAHVTIHMSELFYVDEAIAYFVLLAVLMKTTHACTLQRAITVAGAAKVASIAVWSLVSVAMLGLLFSR